MHPLGIFPYQPSPAASEPCTARRVANGLITIFRGLCGTLQRRLCDIGSALEPKPGSGRPTSVVVWRYVIILSIHLGLGILSMSLVGGIKDPAMHLQFVGTGDAFGSGGRFNTCFHVAGREF